MRTLWHRFTLAALFAPAVLAGCSDEGTPATTAGTVQTVADVTKINHVVVIYLENHSFDNSYGDFAGAEGRAAASTTVTQVNATGVPFTTLPQRNASPFPTTLANAPFDISQYVAPTVTPPDLIHKYYQEQQQIDGGKMDKFALVSDAQGQTMGYYKSAVLPLAAEAAKYTLCDHFFHSAFGGSFLNHIYFISAAVPVNLNAPATSIAVLNAVGDLVTDGSVTPDGYVVNTSYSVNTPHPASAATAALVPNQTMPTIGDRLSAAGTTWVWYSGGWNDALAGKADALFQFHHQPFVYFANYADGTAAKAAHLKDETEFMTSAVAGTLPAVSFVKPIGANNEHPGYTDIITGENHTLQLINAVRNGPNWHDTAIIITYDENGGQWDHVAPPKVDRWGPGTRVPTIIISPYARRAYVDKSNYETVSILSFIEKRWNLAPLSTRDAAAGNLLNAFDFSQTPN